LTFAPQIFASMNIGKSSIWHPHLKNVKSWIKKILKRVYFKGLIRKIGA
jgi:disulfide oxidoreductase YuzD